MTDTVYKETRNFDYRRAVLYLLLPCAFLLYMSRTHGWLSWRFMVTAYCVGIFIWIWDRYHTRSTKASLFSYLFPRNTWLHPSSINDAVLALIAYGMAILPFSETFVWRAVQYFTGHHFSAPIFFAHMPPFSVMALYTLASILAADIGYYITHRLMHTVPMLWEFHKIHHSAEVMTPLAVSRLHPLDWLFTSFGRQVGHAITILVFLQYYPGAASIAFVSGVTVALNLPTNISGSLRHSHIWLRFGRVIEHVLISPAQHQIHHSIDARHINKNYGSIFALWDWMFSSLYVPAGKENITFGLANNQMIAPYHSVWGLIIQPFRQFYKRGRY